MSLMIDELSQSSRYRRRYPMPPLPEAIILVLAPLTPLFSTRVWCHVQLLLLRAMLAHGPRTVTAALQVMGLTRERRFTNYHRVLSRATCTPRAGLAAARGPARSAGQPRSRHWPGRAASLAPSPPGPRWRRGRAGCGHSGRARSRRSRARVSARRARLGSGDRPRGVTRPRRHRSTRHAASLTAVWRALTPLTSRAWTSMPSSAFQEVEDRPPRDARACECDRRPACAGEPIALAQPILRQGRRPGLRCGRRQATRLFAWTSRP